MSTWLLVCAGAALGAPARWVLDGAVQRRVRARFPVGILVVNVVGSFVLGALLAGTLGWDGREAWVALVGVGFCGAFTTFSTFTNETVVLAETGATAAAVANVVVTVAACTAAAFGGWILLGGPT
jgi:fluoride exporter